MWTRIPAQREQDSGVMVDSFLGVLDSVHDIVPVRRTSV
jgi:hypothetical protein